MERKMMDEWIDKQVGRDIYIQGSLKHRANQMVLSNQFKWKNETHKRKVNEDP